MIDYKQYYFYKYPRYQISKGISKGIIVDTEKRQIRNIPVEVSEILLSNNGGLISEILESFDTENQFRIKLFF